jgi:oligosaccharide repeat unit polymerase
MDANWLMIAILAFLTTLAVIVGRWWLGRLFNPLSIYSALWGFCLINYELRLIQYYEISTAAWLYIGLAWLSLYLGAGFILLVDLREKTSRVPGKANLKRLRGVIIGLSLVGGLGLVSQIFAISREFGNPFVALITNPGDIYGARAANELSAVSYVGAFTFAACTLAGIYTAKVGRFTLIGTAPLVLVAFQLFSVMGRTGLGVAAVLFAVSFVYTPKPIRFEVPMWQRLVAAAVAMTLVATFVAVSAVRHLNVEFAGITPKMEEISDYVPFFPSVYSNFSATPVAFSLYLATPEQEKAGFWGMYTFAPIFRFLSRLGFPCAVAAHEENYYTPVPMNTSTYLKNVYSDFGPVGVVIFPSLLGACLALLINRASGTLGLALLANLFVLAVFAFAFNFMLLGDWYIGLGGSVFGAVIADVGCK